MALLPILVWLLRQHFKSIPIQPEFADLRRLQNPPNELFERIAKSIELYPCDLLFRAPGCRAGINRKAV